MIEQIEITHIIQKYSMRVLSTQKYARFRDMRPQKIDTNLYSYHLKLLQKQKFVMKTPDGYTLTPRGLAYVDRINATSLNLTPQPKVITLLVIQNGFGGILMYQKLRQPFIDAWTVPFGKVHNTDVSLKRAAIRELDEKVSVSANVSLRHVGDCYIRVADGAEPIVSTIAHVFYGTTDDDLTALNPKLHWITPRALIELDTTPAMKDVIARTFFRDPFFFEEFDVAC